VINKALKIEIPFSAVFSVALNNVAF